MSSTQTKVTFPFGINPHIEDKGHCADAYVEVNGGLVPLEFADISSLYLPHSDGRKPVTTPGLVLLSKVSEAAILEACQYLGNLNFFDYYQPLTDKELDVIEKDSFRDNPRTRYDETVCVSDFSLSTVFSREYHNDCEFEEFVDPHAGIFHFAVRHESVGVFPFTCLTIDFFHAELGFLKEPGAPPCLAEPLFSVIEKMTPENIRLAVDHAASQNMFANYRALNEKEINGYLQGDVEWPPRTINAKRYRWLHLK